MDTKKLTRALELARIEWRDYSGRGMFGASCVGVACGGRDGPSEGEVLQAVKGVKGALSPSRDSLGMGSIVYWPNARLEEEDA